MSDERDNMKKVCKKCDAENPADYLLCKNCGEELEPSGWERGRKERKKEREEREWKDGEWEKAHPENPAISWMILGCILVVVGLIVVMLASAWTPDSPSTLEVEDWKAYANELQEKATYIFYGGVIEIIGFLIFMPATIWGVSWNARLAHTHE